LIKLAFFLQFFGSFLFFSEYYFDPS